MKKKELLSVIVPFRDDDGTRGARKIWLIEHWKKVLSEHGLKHEIILCSEDGVPFSKAVAVHNGVAKSRGDILALIDADTVVPGYAVAECVRRIRLALERGDREWAMPYKDVYRLTLKATASFMEGELPLPPTDEDIEDFGKDGFRYGAMIQIMPREAWDTVQGFDPRFRGWGGEDVCLKITLDTLYTEAYVFPSDLIHLWHDRPGREKGYATRYWPGQVGLMVNSRLASRYGVARGKPNVLRALIAERDKPRPKEHGPVGKAIDLVVKGFKYGAYRARLARCRAFARMCRSKLPIPLWLRQRFCKWSEWCRGSEF